jgi:hypothetical protein
MMMDDRAIKMFNSISQPSLFLFQTEPVVLVSLSKKKERNNFSFIIITTLFSFNWKKKKFKSFLFRPVVYYMGRCGGVTDFFRSGTCVA